MSVNPIDLQTLFSHIDIATKDVMQQREAAIHAQGIIGQHVSERSVHGEHSVTETHSIAEESVLIDVDEDSEAEQQEKKKEPYKKNNSTSRRYANFEDPLRGKRVDLIG